MRLIQRVERQKHMQLSLFIPQVLHSLRADYNETFSSSLLRGFDIISGEIDTACGTAKTHVTITF